MKRDFSNVKRVVVKLGTNILTQNNAIDFDLIERLAGQISSLHHAGKKVLLVSSGAIGIGAQQLKINRKITKTSLRQACAAIGQPMLMHRYRLAFQQYDIQIAQVLITKEIMDQRMTYNNLSTAVDTLLNLGVIPIFNENDCVSTAEIGPVFGDNDQLSAMIASKLEAELLVLLSDIDAFYDANPKENIGAKPLSVISEITPEKIYNKRRSFIKSMGCGLGALTMSSVPLINNVKANTNLNKPTSYKDITTYNNYYEFGTSKSDPYRKSKDFITKPWSVKIEGEVEKSLELPIEEILAIPSEERVLKLRCVEGWSMVIPWLGFSLSELLNKVKIKPSAKYVEFETDYNPEEMVGQRYPVLNWPYIEGLRIDEAMHPLTTVVTGLYGKSLPNQNGAPLRIFIPWKYGFKSAKAIVKIRLVKKMPNSAWMNASPREYGFYSNVNPEVDHPRWSQATERIIGEGILAPRVKTLMFNGYGDEVAHLYSGMNLKKNY